MTLPLELGGIRDPHVQRALQQIAQQFPIVATGGGGGGAPSGPAGGVLGGTYPNPAFAVDMATQAELDAHTTLTTTAHGGIVASTDARLTDARTPTAHHATHEPGGTDAMAVDALAATGSLRTLGTGAQQAAAGNDSRLSNARTPTAHQATHQSGGTDALTGNLDAVGRSNISKAGALVAARRGLNLIEGTNVTITAADNAGSERVDVTINSSAAGSSTIPISATLPASPTNGQMFVYEVQTTAGSPAANANVEWLFRWNSTTAKWHFLGGPPLRILVDTAQATTTTAAFQDLTTLGPQFTAPFLGDYLFDMGAQATSASASTPIMGLSVGGAAPAADAQISGTIAIANAAQPLNRQVLVASLAAAATARMRYQPQSVATTFSRRVLTVQPIWVA